MPFTEARRYATPPRVGRDCADQKHFQIKKINRDGRKNSPQRSRDACQSVRGMWVTVQSEAYKDICHLISKNHIPEIQNGISGGFIESFAFIHFLLYLFAFILFIHVVIIAFQLQT
jgi:hypothetical protein